MANDGRPDEWGWTPRQRSIPTGLGAGCGPIVVGLILIAATVFGVGYVRQRQWERARMREDLATLHLERWQTAVSECKVDAHFEGGRRLYRLQLDPAEALAFLRAAAGTEPQPEHWTNAIGTDAPGWWTPNDQTDLWISRVNPASWAGWTLAASPTTGRAYMERVGG